MNNEELPSITLLPVVDDVALETRISKAGKPYQAVVIHYVNGFTQMIFPDQAAKFVLESLAESAQATE